MLYRSLGAALAPTCIGLGVWGLRILKHKKPTLWRALCSEMVLCSQIAWPVLPALVQPIVLRRNYNKPSMFLAASRETSTPS